MSWNRETNKTSTSQQDTRNKHSRNQSIIYVAIGFCILFGIGWGVKAFLSSRVKAEAALEVKEKKHSPKKPSTPSEDVAKKAKPSSANTFVLTPPKASFGTLISSVTSSTGRIVEKFRGADGKTHKVRWWAKPPLFRHATDNVLSMLLTQRGSGPIPPIPYTDNMDKVFLESLKDPIIIDKNASPEIQERQRIVREARIEVKALMDQGLSFREISAEHESLMNKNAALRAEALAALKKERDKGDSEGTREFLEKINETLEDMGVEPISMPTHPVRN